ncbi:Fic family protein [Labedaea rhizosphaerae]|uniref:protein adenylyltransferase n=1 Tax=Labedaea rhizosphaerae TaxID=598644 RepID=A0A4R6SLM4_LABRH|nr:Fic family protein [Labedaea rhizosphaerae]TDQ05009.1 Fic/DOC family protein [Labedaea rhizosphaerae]
MPPHFVADQMSSVLAELDRDRWLIGRSRASVLERLAYYYGEINARHPFREGNGRTLRAFLRQLCASAGYRLDWSALDREANMAASEHCFHTGKYDRLVAVLDPVVHRI